MSRVIKFRVWQESSKTYLHPQNAGPSGLMMTHSLGLSGYLSVAYPWTPPLILEQFTGLQDKNGCDIYEGDILAANLGTLTIPWLNIGYVRYLPENACYMLQGAAKHERLDMYLLDEELPLTEGMTGKPGRTCAVSTWRLEIIANIHFNPEFLST